MRAFVGWYIYIDVRALEFSSLVSFTTSPQRAAPSYHFLVIRFDSFSLAFPSTSSAESCKFCSSRFQGEGVTLKFLSCLNGLLSIREQLSCLESVFRLPEKRTGRCQEGSAVCIVHLIRNILISVVAVCSPQFVKEASATFVV
ncbi:unnamed protein product [Sphenostylis stenocarpa]|uniref:Uncharacterized protein n=1 Tax=Sphenostylis stenocarpa TaxID=92480 RepID=A0AA86RX83_9FABA|nr:unnamed protein product [Sphenostylis stenocarpa]